MVKRRLHPGSKSKNTDEFVRLRFAKGADVEGRPSIPLWPNYAAVWLRAHIQQPISRKS